MVFKKQKKDKTEERSGSWGKLGDSCSQWSRRLGVAPSLRLWSGRVEEANPCLDWAGLKRKRRQPNYQDHHRSEASSEGNYRDPFAYNPRMRHGKQILVQEQRDHESRWESNFKIGLPIAWITKFFIHSNTRFMRFSRWIWNNYKCDKT